MRFVAVVAALPLLVGLARTGIAQEQAGVSAAVRGDVQLVATAAPRAGLAGRRVASGEPIYMGDRIGTGPESGMQLMLLDETTLTIGPNAAVTVDAFVYDPARGTGKVNLSVTRGAFRFITGRIARNEPQNVEIRTPAGTLGIRGTIVVGRVEDSGRVMIALAGPGPNNNIGAPRGGFDFVAAGGTVSARKPGWGVSVEPGGPARSLQFAPADIEALGPRPIATAPRLPGPPGPPPPGAPPPLDPGEAGQRRAGALDRVGAIRPLREDARALEAGTLTALVGAGKDANRQTTFAELRLLNKGSATFSQTGVAMHRVGTGAPDGSYNFTMTINFAARTYSGSFTNINVPSAGITSETVTLNTPSGGSYALPPGKDFANFAGTSAGCVSAGRTCTGFVQTGTADGITAKVLRHTLRVNNSGAITEGTGKVRR